MRYFVGFLIAIGLIVLLIVLIFGGSHKTAKVPTAPKTLSSYSTTDAVAILTIDGPIIDPQDHNSVQISVSNVATTLTSYQGYDGQVVNQQSFPNSTNSYDNFLHALAVAGFTQGNSDPTLSNERGYCPTGDRYIFQLDQDGKHIERFWATSCGKPKTYNGNVSLTLNLFETQVPKYNQLAQNLHL